MFKPIPIFYQKLIYLTRIGCTIRNRYSLSRIFSNFLANKLKSRFKPESLCAEFNPVDAPYLTFGSVSSQVIESLYWHGVRGYEGELTDIWRELCAQSMSTIEIGGNIGLYAVLGAHNSNGNYCVFEPVPMVAAELARNLALNGLTNRVQLINKAVVPGHGESKVRITLPDESRKVPVGAYVSMHSETDNRTTHSILDVDAVGILDLLESADLIKIDAEGIEFSLLLSALPQLKIHLPSIIVEVLPTSGKLHELLLDLLANSNYRVLIAPEWGNRTPILLDKGQWSAKLTSELHAKDVVLLSPKHLKQLKIQTRKI